MVGTSAVVYPAAAIPYAAGVGGAYLVVVNKEATEHSEEADLFLEGAAGEILPKIL